MTRDATAAGRGGSLAAAGQAQPGGASQGPGAAGQRPGAAGQGPRSAGQGPGAAGRGQPAATGSAGQGHRGGAAQQGEVLDDPRLTAMGLLAETFTGLQAKLAPALASAGLSLTDFDVLLRLARSAGQRLRMTDLATQTALSTSGITRVVDRMEHRGLVSRESCASDRRGAYAVLTDAGGELVGGLARRHVQDLDRWFTGLLSADQLDALLGALRLVRDEVRPGATAGVCTPADRGENSSSEVTSL